MLLCLKIIKELELPVSKRVRFIVGTDEESGWGDMDYYFAHNGLKDPDFGFSPDAVNNEVGTIQPIKEISEVLAEFPKIHFHVDAVQAIDRKSTRLNSSH